MLTEKKENRGGARANAGVKANPAVGKRIKVATTLTPRHYELIQQTNKPLSKVIEAALNVYFARSDKGVEIENKK